MSIPVSATGAGAAIAAQDSVKPKEEPSAGAVAAKAQAALNVSIVQASLSVSISAGNEPLALLLKSAITSINEELKADFGDDAIQNAAVQDNTPEGTASRIVTLSTAFYEACKQQNGGVDDPAMRDKFAATIRSGVERGFKEARDILGGLKVLEVDIAANIDKTYALVLRDWTRSPRAAASHRSPAARRPRRTEATARRGRARLPWRGTGPRRPPPPGPGRPDRRPGWPRRMNP